MTEADVATVGGWGAPASVLALLRESRRLCADVRDDAERARAVLALLLDFTDLQVAHLAVCPPTTSGESTPAVPVRNRAEVWLGTDSQLMMAVRMATVRNPRSFDAPGLPGTAAEGPIWGADAAELDARFADGAFESLTAFAFPVIEGGQTVAVAELLGRTDRPAHPDLLEAADIIGRELGHQLGSQDDPGTLRQHEIANQTAQLVAARNSAVAADRARIAFFAAVSHDLRTPIHSVLAAADQLREASAEDAPALIDTIETSTRTLLDQLDEMLALSQPPPQENLHPVATRVREALENAVAAYSRLYAQDRPPLRLVIDPNLEQEVLLQRAGFLRLVDAVYAGLVTLPQRDQIIINVALDMDHLNADITGFDPSELPGSWQLVEQALTAIDGAVEPLAAGGVRLLIPATLVTAPHVREGVGRRVLLVDDTAVTRGLGQAMVSSLGYEVDVADGGKSAIDAVARRAYGLVLMDLRMPDIDGLTATRAIRSGVAGPSAAGLPIVALTAHAVAGAREEALMAGMDDFVTKPFNRQTLRPVLERFLPPQE